MDRHSPKKRGKRKGSLEETISYAIYKDNPFSYVVSYRDKDQIKEATLKDFLNAEEYSPIPFSRVTQVTKLGMIVWKKGQKEILVKGKMGQAGFEPTTHTA